MRLAKYLANAGVASRRAAEEIVRAGRVTVAGITITDPAKDVDGTDEIVLDGKPVRPAGDTVVYAANKPLGVVSTASDPQRRPTVVGLVPKSETRRLYPVGRLDIDTTGLILLTNDGELAHRLMHPSFEIDKTYRATIRNPPIGDRAVRQLRQGVDLDDGRTAPARVRRITPDTIEITIHEGRKRQVRRMFERVGHVVQRLERIAFGPLTLGTLEPGHVRKLTDAEYARLKSLSAGTAARRRAAGSSSAPARSRRR
jgi:23S rRNA pseudouridine2605 synthase